MKKITLIFAFSIINLTVFLSHATAQNANEAHTSQSVKWGEIYTKEDNNSIYDYIGSIDQSQYYSFGYNTIGFSISRFNRLGFMRVENQKVTMYNNDYIQIPKYSLIETFTTGQDIVILYSEENSDEERNEIKCVRVDKNTLKEKSRQRLISFPKGSKDISDVRVLHSKDRSKILIACLNRNRKTNEGSFTLNVYNQDLEKQYTQSYIPKQEGDISLLDVCIDNDGSVFLLSAVRYNDKKAPNRAKLSVARLQSEDQVEQMISEDVNVVDAKFLPLEKNKALIAINSGSECKVITYDFEKEDVLNTLSTTYTKSKEKTYWTIDDILRLENGNCVVVVKDAYRLLDYSQTNTVCYDRNLYTFCVNPQQGAVVYAQLISKAIAYMHSYDVKKGQFECPFYFTKGNDFYVLYNADKGDDDLCGEVFIKTNITLPQQTRDVVANLIKIGQDGKPILKNLFFYKDDKALFSQNLTSIFSDGSVQVGRMGKKDVEFGLLQLDK
jgi:hypothetical protein